MILGAIILLATLGPGSGPNPNVLQSPGMILFFLLVFGLFALYFVLPIIAAVACALGKEFRYPLRGGRLARYLGYEALKAEQTQWLDEDHEFRWVAAMGHFSILVMIWGMLAPLTAWMLQGKNSLFLKFQSIQTLIYQAATTVVIFIGGFLYLFGLAILLLSMTAVGGSDFNSSTGIVGMVVMGAVLLISIVVILSVPLLHILGQWAGYRVLKGEDYRYPWIGRIVETRVSRTSTRKESSS
jgi:uncharacterized Tic20 family protein